MLNTTNIINKLANKGFKDVTVNVVVKNGVSFEGLLYRPEGRKTGVTVYTDGCKTDAEAIARCESIFSRPIPDYDNVFDNFDKSKLTARIFAKGKSGSNIARPYLDLEICPYYTVSVGEDGVSACKLTSEVIDFTGMSVNDILDTALANTFTDCTVNTLSKVLSEITGMPEEIWGGTPIWVISNTYGLCGAVNIANVDALADLADKLNSDLYILPASIHEVLAVPTEKEDPVSLRSMVSEINCVEVKAEEVLSDTIYRFDRKTKTVVIA